MKNRKNTSNCCDILIFDVFLPSTGNIKYFPKVDFVVTPVEMMEIINKITF